MKLQIACKSFEAIKKKFRTGKKDGREFHKKPENENCISKP